MSKNITAEEFLETQDFTKLTSTGIVSDKEKVHEYAKLLAAEKIREFILASANDVTGAIIYPAHSAESFITTHLK